MKYFSSDTLLRHDFYPQNGRRETTALVCEVFYRMVVVVVVVVVIVGGWRHYESAEVVTPLR